MSRLFFVILILSISQIRAQESIKLSPNNLPSNPEENIVLHTDRDFYLCGEKIWFKSYCLYQNRLLNEDLSKVLYVELYNDELILKHKFEITKGISSGSIQIPSDYKTGNYVLRAYTKYLQNFNVDDYFSKFISIVNPNEPPTKLEMKIINDSSNKFLYEHKITNLGSFNTHSDQSIDQKKLKISTNKESFKTRELVSLTIDPSIFGSRGSLDLNVSVVKKGTFRNSTLSNQLKKHETAKSSLPLKWIPETRDVSISGTAYNSNTNKPVSDLRIYISAFKDPAQIHIIRTKQNGEFIYSLNNLKDQRDIYLSPRSINREPIELKINNDFSTLFKDFKLNPIVIDSNKKILIEELNINYQAGNIFKTDPGTTIIETKSLPFNFDTPPFSVNLDKYVKTPTLEMVFDELIPRCIVIKRRGNYHLIVDNEEDDILYKNPLVLIDNIPIFDMNALMEISPSKIENISCYTLPLVLGDNIIKGLVLITTRTDNFGGIKMPEGSIFLNYQMISTSNKFESLLYDSEEKRLSRLADFRTTLYWNPELLLENKTTIQFYTSDHESEYVVIVRGLSANGEYYCGETSFAVVKK